MRLAGRDHREAVFQRGDAAVEQHRLLHLDHFHDRAVEIAGLDHLHADRAIGLGELDEVRHRLGVGMRQAVAVQQLLPLAHHAHVVVVQDEHLDRQIILHRGSQLLPGHLHRGVAGDIDHQAVRMGDLHADRRRQAVAHGAETARGHPALRLLKAVELRRPHLMLTDFGGDVGVTAAGRLIQPLNGVLRHDQVVVLLVGQRIAAAPGADLLPPRLGVGLLALGLERGDQIAQHVGDVADDRHIDLDVLVDRRRVDIDVDLLGARRERIGTAGDPVVEARADAQHDVAAMHGHVGLVGAVHAEHAEPVLARRRIGSETHQGRGNREIGQLDQLAQQLAGLVAGIDHAAAGIDHRLLGVRQQRHRLADLRGVALQLRRVGDVHVGLARRMIGAGRELHVLRHVDHHRARTAAGRDIKRLVQHLGQILNAAHQPVVLGARPGDADGVAFLEGVVADQMGRHLAGDAHQRNRVHQRVGQRGHHVGGAGTRGHQHHAGLAGRAGITFGGVAGALLVPHQNVLDVGLLIELVIDWKYRTARIAENVLDAVVLHGAHDHGCAGHLVGVVTFGIAHGWLRVRPAGAGL